MPRRLHGFIVRALVMLGVCAAPLAAQSTMTITGHVSAPTGPVRGARLRIEVFDLGAETDENGRYSLIIPSARIRGQTVQMTVSYPRFRTQTADVTLVGGALVKDFELSTTAATPGQGAPQTRTGNPPAGNNPPVANNPAPANVPVAKPGEPTPTLAVVNVPSSAAATPHATVPVQSIDSTVFGDVAGNADIASVLQGRLAGVDVQTSSTVGGTSSIVLRGPRSLFGITQPLVVVNGIIVDNSNLTTAAQRSGLGGFDYGTLLSDFNVEDVALVQVLSGPEAALRFGGRGANGVLSITTRSAHKLNGFEVAASQQVAGFSTVKLPVYQNQYGQGLGGKFAFFNGKGGGVNDATDESWGPALDGTPVAQASLVEAGRADVRSFLPVPGNVSGYYQSGHSLATNVSLLGGNDQGQVRLAFSNRSITGVVPSASLTARSALVTGSATPNTKVSLTGDLQYYDIIGSERPGSGFDESNVVSQFSHMPRQVDVATYKLLLRDATGAQLSWNYAGRNNPWFGSLFNKNHDNRTRFIGGGSAAVAFSSNLTATAHIGADHSSDTRFFSVASGWMGGYPFALGRGDFTNGGFENDDITRTATNADVMVRAVTASSGTMSLAFTGGIGRRSDALDVKIRASDKLSDTTSGAPSLWTNTTSTNFVFGGAEALVRDLASVTVGVRQESSSLTGASSNSTFYPAVLASIDLARLDSGAKKGTVESFILHGGWSKSGNDVTGAMLQRLGFSAANIGQVSAVAAPETTTGFEAGVSLRALDRRVMADVTVYSERSENLVFPSATAYQHTASMSNKGIEAALTVVPVRMSGGSEWAFGANFTKNSNTVESLSGGVSSIALATPFNDLSVEARTGQPIGALVGYAYRRDASGQLLLRNGLPQADSAAGRKLLAQSAPAWIGGLTTVYRTHGIELSALVDTHHGGKVFSSSTRAGSISGTLVETANRPTDGMLVAGVDASGAANTTRVSTEAYYHALAPITERWLYDASYVKLREVRVSYTLPLQFISALRAQTVRAAFIGRNLSTSTDAPIDPETVLSTSPLRGVEMGQLPSTRTLGIQITIVP